MYNNNIMISIFSSFGFDCFSCFSCWTGLRLRLSQEEMHYLYLCSLRFTCRVSFMVWKREAGRGSQLFNIKFLTQQVLSQVVWEWFFLTREPTKKASMEAGNDSYTTCMWERSCLSEWVNDVPIPLHTFLFQMYSCSKWIMTSIFLSFQSGFLFWSFNT